MGCRTVAFLFLLLSFSIYATEIHTFLEAGEESLYKQDYYSAVESYRDALHINSNDLNANKGLSDAFFMLGEYDEALLYIERCITLNRTVLEYKNSRGRILTALGKYQEAAKEYQSVLDVEVFNIGAQSGMAELRIVEGDLKGSLYDFEKILKFSPESRRLLLSLVVLYDSQHNFNSSDALIQKAIRYYPRDPVVLEGAVRHYMAKKSYSGAALYMDELYNISDSSSIILLKAELLLYLEEYDEALKILTEYMKIEKENHYAYYLAGVILDITGEKERALSLMKRGLDLKPDEEIYRFYIEQIVNDLYTLKDDKRDDYSSWYYDQGKILESRYYYEKAGDYYMRGLDLNPLSTELRVARAEILKKMGYRSSYLKELELVLDQDSSRNDIEETLMIEKSLPLENLYEKWGSEQFNSQKLLSLSVFVNRDSSENHLFSSSILKDVTSRFLSSESRFSVESVKEFSGSYSEAFNMARESGSDFFITLEYFEGSRTFSLMGVMHLTKSGREIKRFNYLKTGNSRIFHCFDNLASDLNEFFPLTGSVIDIKGDKLLIDIGRVHGVEKDMVFQVVKKGAMELIPETPYLTFSSERNLGELIVEESGEYMSQGAFTTHSTFNLLNIGDNVLFLDQESALEDDSRDKVISDKELIEQLLKVN